MLDINNDYTTDGTRRLHASGQHVGVRRLVASPRHRARLPRRVLLRQDRPATRGGLLRPDVLRRPPRDAGHLRRLGRRCRQIRCAPGEAGPVDRAGRARAGDVAHRAGRDRLHHLLHAVPHRPHLRHSRPSVRRPGGVEHRHLGQRQRGAKLRPGNASGPRRPLRPRRGIPRSHRRAVGHLGGRRDPARPGQRHLRRSGQGPRAATTPASSSRCAGR